MLQHVPSTMPATTAHPRQVRAQRTIGGQNIAKARNRSPRDRAYLAADWIQGGLTLRKPTVQQASRLFGVCEVLIRAELKDLQKYTVAAPPIEAAWTSAPDRERDSFVQKFLPELWRKIDRLTAA